MDAVDLQNAFPSGALCRITLTSSETLEAHPLYMTFTDRALILRGTWNAVTEEDEDAPMIGARVIPWSEVRDIDSSNLVRNWNRDDLKREIEQYGVADTDARMFLSWVQE
ncbi:hypothetical protein ABT282_38015 [Streptomyces sp. NPDC000927]|uniref:hypothetical protein n=1 Tax=Streptomyces sp. NPDC000927 TaxID=3154371 RepID=UPI0033236869